MKAAHLSSAKDREIKDSKQLNPPQRESSHQEAIPGKPTNNHRFLFGQCIFLQQHLRSCKVKIFLSSFATSPHWFTAVLNTTPAVFTPPPESCTLYRLYCIGTVMAKCAKSTGFALVHHSQHVNGMAGKLKIPGLFKPNKLCVPQGIQARQRRRSFGSVLPCEKHFCLCSPHHRPRMAWQMSWDPASTEKRRKTDVFY